ncbi:MAG: hypothetical protein O6943_11210, partial [Bacteroidetes bacterium]|nr:hypothetical protein [Bacteroidota bacterium]
VQLINYQRPCQKNEYLDLERVRGSLIMCKDRKEETRQDLEKTLDGFFKKTNQPKNYIINYFLFCYYDHTYSYHSGLDQNHSRSHCINHNLRAKDLNNELERNY